MGKAKYVPVFSGTVRQEKETSLSQTYLHINMPNHWQHAIDGFYTLTTCTTKTEYVLLKELRYSAMIKAKVKLQFKVSSVTHKSEKKFIYCWAKTTYHWNLRLIRLVRFFYRCFIRRGVELGRPLSSTYVDVDGACLLLNFCLRVDGIHFDNIVQAAGDGLCCSDDACILAYFKIWTASH